MMLVLVLFLKNAAGDPTLTGPSVVKQCPGRSLHIVCRYHRFYRDHAKYWCKGYYFNHCTVLGRTSQSQDVYKTLQISDDKRGGFFSVRMTSAQTADSGWYWCAIERVSRHVSIAVQLIISAEDAQHCSVPPNSIIEATNRPLPTSALTTFITTTITSTSHALTEIKSQTSHGEIYINECFAHKIWSIARWFVFIGMCVYLSCFITCVEIWFRR